jgi:hypothetical protein
MERFSTPDEVAAVVAFQASAMRRQRTGDSFPHEPHPGRILVVAITLLVLVGLDRPKPTDRCYVSLVSAIAPSARLRPTD